jgi:alkylation response protein AidB-like acyl-CoA dehydrogenase
MATALTEELQSLLEEVGRFARGQIAARAGLSASSEFPWDIWRAMGQAGLLGVGVPGEYGGRGGDYLSLVVAGEALVRHGGSLGMGLSVALHQIVARFLVAGLGTAEQRQEFLPPTASGKITASLAASEPRTGAHPKHLKTTARIEGGHYVIKGDKTYLTNGPIADLFIVIAVTGSEADRKQLSAVLVPADSPGLSRSGPMELDFLRPSPHGSITLSDVRVPLSHLLGREGEAYEGIVKPFREVEDTVLMGPVCGAMQHQLELLAELVRVQGIPADDLLKESLGRLQFLAHEARIIAYETAQMLDRPGHDEFTSLLLAGRDLVRRFLSEYEALISRVELEPSQELTTLTKDLTFISTIAGNVARQKQIKIGEGIL